MSDRKAKTSTGWKESPRLVFDRTYGFALVLFFCLWTAGSARAQSAPIFSPKVEIISSSFQKQKFMFPGDVLLVVVQADTKSSELSGEFAGRPLLFFESKPKTWNAFAALNVTEDPGRKTLQIQIKKEDQTLLNWKQDIKVRPLTLRPRILKGTKEPDAVDLARDERDRVEQREIFSRVTSELLLDGAIQKPVPGASSGKFGRPSLINGEKRSPHSGEDLEAKLGDPVKASARGRVVAAKDYYFLGQTVILDHGYGLFSYYSHLSEMSVKEGDLLSQGALLGKAGKTGRATGVHVHWGIKLGDLKVNPIRMLELPLATYLH